MHLLVVKASSLGDIIQTFPTVNYLKNKFPQATIDWVVESSFAELVQAHPDIDNVIVIDTKQWRKHPFSIYTWKSIAAIRNKIQNKSYDIVFDLQGNMKSGLMTFFSKSKVKVGLAWKSISEIPNLLFTHQRYNFTTSGNICEDYLYIVQQFFHDASPFQTTPIKLKLTSEQQKILEKIKQTTSAPSEIMICPGSAWPNKQLSQQALIEFLHLLHRHKPSHFLLVWGSSSEYEYTQTLHQHFPNHSIVLPKVPLPVLQNYMDEMDLVIAVDSLPLHLAGTTRTSTFSIFGASKAQKFKPQGSQHIAMQGKCPYSRQFKKDAQYYAPAQRVPASNSPTPKALLIFSSSMKNNQFYSIASEISFKIPSLSLPGGIALAISIALLNWPLSMRAVQVSQKTTIA